MVNTKGLGLGLWHAGILNLGAAGTCAMSHPQMPDLGKTRQPPPGSPHLPGLHFPHLWKEEVEQDQGDITQGTGLWRQVCEPLHNVM